MSRCYLLCHALTKDGKTNLKYPIVATDWNMIVNIVCAEIRRPFPDQLKQNEQSQISLQWTDCREQFWTCPIDVNCDGSLHIGLTYVDGNLIFRVRIGDDADVIEQMINFSTFGIWSLDEIKQSYQADDQPYHDDKYKCIFVPKGKFFTKWYVYNYPNIGNISLQTSPQEGRII